MVKIGIVGCGGIANYHMNHLSKMEDVRVVAACDLIEERAEKMAARAQGAALYTDYRDMFAAEEMDAVFICVPPYAHPDIELEAARRKVHVFIEKPMALSMEAAEQVAQAFKENGIISAVGFQDRYLDIVDNMREYLKDRQVGIITGAWIGGVPGVPWWRKKAQSGGQVPEQNIHLFDLVRLLFGEVKRVYSVCGRGIVDDVPGLDVEEYSLTTMELAGGQICTLATGCYIKAGSRNGLDIYCRDARVEYSLRRYVCYHEADRTLEVRKQADNGYLCDRTFVEAVMSGDPSKIRSPYHDALKSLQVTLAANSSMESGVPIDLT